MNEPLTPLEQQVYHYLIDFLTENTFQPSLRDIAREVGVKSTATVSELIGLLAKKGYLERVGYRSRGVRLIGYAGMSKLIPVPCYSRVNAGQSPLLDEDRTGHLTFDRRFIPHDGVFLLRVDGESIPSHGIFDGDYVLVDPSAPAADGAVIVARIGAETSIRTISHMGASTVLMSASLDEGELVVGPSSDFAVIGVVCGVFRPMFDKQPDLPVTS